MSDAAQPVDEAGSAEERILDAVLVVLARDGAAGVSMRAVSREAGVALGLASYYFENKNSLICAALRRIGDQDAALVEPQDGIEPEKRLKEALRHVVDDGFLQTDYLGLRLQLWSLAGTDPTFAEINRDAQIRYRNGLASLIAAARPNLKPGEIARRAADILVIQNGMWLTSILIVDEQAIRRGVQRCEELALAD